MHELKFFLDVGATVACHLQLVLQAENCGLRSKQHRSAIEQQVPHLIISDS